MSRNCGTFLRPPGGSRISKEIPMKRTGLTNQYPLWAGLVLFFVMLACSMPGVSAPAGDGAPEESSPVVTLAAQPAETDGAVETSEESDELANFVSKPGARIAWFDWSEFVYVPAGEFVMGQDKPEGGDNSPAHRVRLSGFWIHQAEVTNQQYAACVAAGKCSPPAQYPKIPYWYVNPQMANAPVTGVNWNQAAIYCEWIDARLPTEAEWEKAAHGPLQPTDVQKIFPWGDQEPTCDLLNFNNCLDPSQPELVRTYAAGISPFNLLDMSGNAFEWVYDWYDKDYYAVSVTTDPTGPVEGTLRVYRGGGYDSPPLEVRPDVRFALEPQKHAANLGFRCVLTGQAPPPMCIYPTIDDTPSSTDPDWDFRVVAYCEDRQRVEHTGVNITINMPADELDDYSFEVSGNGTPLTCSPIAPDRLGCSGAPLIQNTNVEIEVCRDYTGPALMPPSPTCPEGYFYNPDTGTCSHTLPEMDEWGGCPHGYEMTLFGCLPISEGDCPPGFEYYESPSLQVCVPTSPCVLPGSEELPECERECWDGFIYNPDDDCCVPDGVVPFCPPGFTYVGGSYCRPQEYVGPACETQTVYIPPCPTSPPPPTAPPPDQCFCCQFTTQTECNANANYGCWWITLGSTAFCSGP
jgi:formylglycine-generating enzyme required for sulfatase activity